jgi:glucose-1-phosphate thymidylyltransferase
MTSDLNSNIVGIIPAAGKGSRLYPFPCPKELFPVGYQDILIAGALQKRPKVISQYLIENIINAGAKRFLFILGEEKHDIMRYYSDGARFGVDVAYLFQEKLYGMPFAINQARNWVNESTVLFGMPDTIIEPKDAFQQLLTRHRGYSADLTLGLFPTENPSKFGMVDVDSSDTINFIVDKPQKTALRYMWGCACWSSSFTQLLDDYLRSYPYEGREMVLGDVFLYAIKNNLTVKAIKFDHGQYTDIGTVDELDSALKKFHL